MSEKLGWRKCGGCGVGGPQDDMYLRTYFDNSSQWLCAACKEQVAALKPVVERPAETRESLDTWHRGGVGLSDDPGMRSENIFGPREKPEHQSGPLIASLVGPNCSEYAARIVKCMELCASLGDDPAKQLENLEAWSTGALNIWGMFFGPGVLPDNPVDIAEGLRKRAAKLMAAEQRLAELVEELEAVWGDDHDLWPLRPRLIITNRMPPEPSGESEGSE